MGGATELVSPEECADIIAWMLRQPDSWSGRSLTSASCASSWAPRAAVTPEARRVPHIDGLWHSTIMGPDYDGVFEPLHRLFGAVVMHREYSEDPAVGAYGGMLWIGDNSIEIGAPVGPQSPVRKFVERLGGGMHSMALRVADVPAIDAMKTRFAQLGVKVVVTIGDQVFFTAPADTGGLLLEWSAMQTDDDPRFGYGRCPSALPDDRWRRRALRVRAAAVADPSPPPTSWPACSAPTWCVPIRTLVLARSRAIVSLVDNLLVLFALPADDGSWPWGVTPTRPRFHGQGLVVDDLDRALTRARRCRCPSRP